MKYFDMIQFERISNFESSPCISLFLPTEGVGTGSRQDAIRLKNLLRTAEEKLVNYGLRTPLAKQMLKVAAKLPEEDANWSKSGKGLAVFFADDFFETIVTPFSLHEAAFVDKQFRLRPLLPMLERSEAFYVLSLSQNDVELFQVKDNLMDQVLVPNMPNNMDRALNIDQADRGSQVHTASRNGSRKQTAVFHGQGGKQETAKQEIESFFRRIDDAVSDYLHSSDAPLVLACVDYEESIYRKVNSYHKLVSDAVHGNVDRMNRDQLRDLAVAAVDSHLNQTPAEAIGRYREAPSQLKTDDVRQVVIAARQGRIDTLFYDPNANVFGQIHPQYESIEITGRDSDIDLVDFAAIATIREGGSIFSMQGQSIETNSPLAAVFRY